MQNNQLETDKIHQKENGKIVQDLCNCHNPNCDGYFLFDGRSQLICEVCKLENCVDCSAIHEFQTCEEFVRESTKNVASVYKTLMEFEEADGIVPNTEPFDCQICFMPCDVGAGIVLRNCLHTFCFDCIRAHILHNTEVQIKCPHMASDYSCDRYLQDRELRSFMDDDEHQKFLKRSLAKAESTIENTFHCLTADCPGWCVLDKDNIEMFNCSACHQANCLTCKTIHKVETCNDYLSSMTNYYTVTQADKMSQSEIDLLVANGKAMICTKCRAVIEKNGGCDGMTCSLCNTALCWATKGARWGPAGHGDYSGGCGCGRNGKCDPNCNNCH